MWPTTVVNLSEFDILIYVLAKTSDGYFLSSLMYQIITLMSHLNLLSGTMTVSVKLHGNLSNIY